MNTIGKNPLLVGSLARLACVVVSVPRDRSFLHELIGSIKQKGAADVVIVDQATADSLKGLGPEEIAEVLIQKIGKNAEPIEVIVEQKISLPELSVAQLARNDFYGDDVPLRSEPFYRGLRSVRRQQRIPRKIAATRTASR
ncbi:MAG: hypothetical protein AAB365_02155 [Patescibacteria group bacterium]